MRHHHCTALVGDKICLRAKMHRTLILRIGEDASHRRLRVTREQSVVTHHEGDIRDESRPRISNHRERYVPRPDIRAQGVTDLTRELMTVLHTRKPRPLDALADEQRYLFLVVVIQKRTQSKADAVARHFGHRHEHEPMLMRNDGHAGCTDSGWLSSS